MNRYIEYLEMEGKSEGYISNARNYLGALGRDLKPRGGLLEIEKGVMIKWLLKVRDHGVSGRGPIAAASLNSVKGTVKACLRFLNDGETPRSFRGITVGKNRSRVTKEGLPTDEDVSRLAKGLSTRNRAILLAIRYTGARPSEVLGLRRQDVDSEFNLSFLDTKTDEHRTVPLVNPDAVAALRDWLEIAPENGYLFPGQKPGHPLIYQSFWVAMQRAAKRLRMKAFNPYDLRHARATELLDAPSALRNRLLGWKSDTMARNYQHVDTGDTRAYLEDREGEAQTPSEELQGIVDRLETFLEAHPELGLSLEGEATIEHADEEAFHEAHETGAVLDVTAHIHKTKEEE